MAAPLSSIYEEGVTVNRQEIQAAIAKSVELRALHAAMMQGNSPAPAPAHTAFLTSASSPRLPRPVSHLSAHDYPVFTPSYVDEPLQGFAHPQTAGQEGIQIDLGENNLQLVNYTGPNESSRRQCLSGLVNVDSRICPDDDTKSVSSWCTYQKPLLQSSPGTETLKSRRRNSLEDFKSVSSCNDSKPATSTVIDDLSNNIAVQLTESHAALNQPQSKPRGAILSWLIPRMKRRQKNGNSSPIRTESEVSHVHKDFGTVSIETLKKELIEANQKRDLALAEVSEMKSSFGELSKKLKTLESYCQKLKKALQQSDQTNSISKEENLMPVSEEVMIEGFLQIVSEARFSVKQFCKLLIEQIDETDEQLSENLNMLLKPYKLSLSSKYSKVVLYHLEAIVNRTFYQDFENCAFQQNGTPKLLDPQQHRKTQFLAFSALRNLSWNEVLRKGTKYYSKEFSQFCDQKMRCVIMTLNWSRSWSDILLQSFFVAAKCIWLLHLLACSFSPPLTILRVEEDRCFDPHYMEDMRSVDTQKAQNPSRVKLLIMPGFYVQDKILRCTVLCRYKSLA